MLVLDCSAAPRREGRSARRAGSSAAEWLAVMLGMEGCGGSPAFVDDETIDEDEAPGVLAVLMMVLRRAARKVGLAEASMSAALSREVMTALGEEVWRVAASASVASARGS